MGDWRERARPTVTRLLWAAALTWWGTYAAFNVWLRVAYPDTRLSLFIDTRLYRLASLAWLQGADPWGPLGLQRYAAPPPTLLFTAPLALVPEAIAVPVFMTLSVLAILFALRRLGLPWYFFLFPPIVDSLITGNPNAMLVALLLSPLAPLAVFAKVYAAIPLLGERRWRALAVTGGLLLLSAPILPWGRYLAELPAITANQALQSTRDLSAWGTPLMLVVVPALALLGTRRAGWLAVPAAWPMTQTTYWVLALPVIKGPFLALALSLPFPLVAPLAITAYAVWAGLAGGSWQSPRLPLRRASA